MGWVPRAPVRASVGGFFLPQPYCGSEGQPPTPIRPQRHRVRSDSLSSGAHPSHRLLLRERTSTQYLVAQRQYAHHQVIFIVMFNPVILVHITVSDILEHIYISIFILCSISRLFSLPPHLNMHQPRLLTMCCLCCSQIQGRLLVTLERSAENFGERPVTWIHCKVRVHWVPTACLSLSASFPDRPSIGLFPGLAWPLPGWSVS